MFTAMYIMLWEETTLYMYLCSEYKITDNTLLQYMCDDDTVAESKGKSTNVKRLEVQYSRTSVGVSIICHNLLSTNIFVLHTLSLTL